MNVRNIPIVIIAFLIAVVAVIFYRLLILVADVLTYAAGLCAAVVKLVCPKEYWTLS